MASIVIHKLTAAGRVFAGQIFFTDNSSEGIFRSAEVFVPTSTLGSAAPSTLGLEAQLPGFSALFFGEVGQGGIIEVVAPDDIPYVVDKDQIGIVRADSYDLVASFTGSGYDSIRLAEVVANDPDDIALFAEEEEIPDTAVTGASYQYSVGTGALSLPVAVTGGAYQWSVGSGTGEVIGDSDLLDSIAVSDTAEDRLAKRLVALLRVLDTPKPVSHTWDDFLDTLLATDNLSAAFTEALASALESTDATTEQRFVRAVDVAMAADTALSFYKAAAVAVVSLAAVDEAGIATLAELADAVETHEATRLRIGTLVTEIAQVLDVAPGTLRLFIDEASVAVVADEAAPLAALRVAVEEGLCPVVSYSFGGSAYVGYVMNTEGSNPVSTYKDFAFNSFTQFAGKHFVAGEGGLYQLGGDTDDGVAIEASFKTMMIDFGTSAMKRVQTAYLGYTASGRLILRVHAVTGGELREHWFEATHHTANAPRQQGRQLGRGLVSRYWQFELINVNGADFHVHEIEFHPIALSRRV